MAYGAKGSMCWSVSVVPGRGMAKFARVLSARVSGRDGAFSLDDVRDAALPAQPTYSYGLYSHGLYSYGLYSYGLDDVRDAALPA